MAARSAAARLLRLWVRIPRGGNGYLSLVIIACCQIEAFASGRSLVQRSPTDCGLSEYDQESSIVRRPLPTRDCCSMVKKMLMS